MRPRGIVVHMPNESKLGEPKGVRVMNRAVRLLGSTAVVASLGLAWMPPASAQRGPGRGMSPDPMMYDTSTVGTIEGTIEGIERVPLDSHVGIHLRVRQGEDLVPVHLGPAWFLDNQDEALVVGARVVVVGSRVSLDGATYWIAAEVRVGDATLMLRDARGVPRWQAWRRGGRGRRGDAPDG
jgi:hypothetical protein